MNFKKLLCLSLIASGALIAAEDYSTGRARMISIMSDDQMGVAAYNRSHIKYAETQNITEDLNIPEIARSFGCKTLIGESYMTETLQYPVSTLETSSVLANRQMNIKALTKDDQLRQAVKELLDVAQESEKDVEALLSDTFKGSTCPELAGLEALKEQKHLLYPMINFFHSNPTGATIGTALNLISVATTVFTTQYLARASYLLFQAGLDYSGAALYATYSGLAAGFYTYNGYKDYKTASEKRRKLHALNRMIDVAEKVEALFTERGLECQFKISAIADTQGKHLIKRLKHRRYQSKTTRIFMLPTVHTFLYELYQHDKHLAQIFACIAEVDAYYSIANRIIESQEGNNKFCFVTSNDQKPNIQAEAFWNVLVKDAVPSDIQEDKHIILTGPNAGGKTTTIRALLQNIVLGQTFGIAAAGSFESCMFDVIHSYLNISDDLLNGKSLFASELKRAQDVLQRIKSLEQGQAFFFALDELFTGTSAEAGEECAYEFIKRIAEFPGVQFVYATHFNKLKELGYESTVCANYKVDAPTKNEMGKLVYPFTLNKGANEVNVALDMAKEAELFA